jgi:hypothetical protein
VIGGEVGEAEGRQQPVAGEVAAGAVSGDPRDRVSVTVDERLDAYLPDRRCTEVEIELRDGSSMALAQPNPIGDTAHFPLGPEEVDAKLRRLLGPSDADLVTDVVARIPDCPSVVAVLDRVP